MATCRTTLLYAVLLVAGVAGQSDWARRAEAVAAAPLLLDEHYLGRSPSGPHDWALTQRARSSGTRSWRNMSGWALPQEVVTDARPEDYLQDPDVPVSWDWRSVNIASGTPSINFVTRVRNQFLPNWCGSCWAHSAAAVIGSRWAIHGTITSGDAVDVSVQYLVNCVTQGDPIKFPESMPHSNGCHGGSSYGAFAFAHSTGVIDSSCLTYTAEANTCNAENTCLQHLHKSGEAQAVTPLRYKAGQFGYIRNESAMLKEVFARGPIACCVGSPDEFKAYTHGVFFTADKSIDCDHLVTVVGFGGEGMSAYWLVQNSYGTAWGERGFFRIKRSSALGNGQHNLGIENFCSWVMPPALNYTRIV